MSTLDNAGYISLFLKTANDHLKTIRTVLAKIEDSNEKTNLIQEVYRNSHSLKGSSSVMGFTELANFSDKLAQLTHPENNFLSHFERNIAKAKKITDEIQRYISSIDTKSLAER